MQVDTGVAMSLVSEDRFRKFLPGRNLRASGIFDSAPTQGNQIRSTGENEVIAKNPNLCGQNWLIGA